MDEIMESKPPPVCSLSSAPNIESPLSLDCLEASLVGKDKGEAKVAADGHSLNPAFETMKMQTSDVCHKNFVIFDYCKGQNTVILHPSWLQSLPHQSLVEPGPLWEVNRFLDSYEDFNSKCGKAMFGFHSHEALTPVLRPVLEVQPKSCNMQNCGLIDVPTYEALNLKKQALEINTHVDEGESLSSDFHENTEEINALLSSDDELSTGYSPSDGASYSETMKSSCADIASRKRQREEFAVEEVDDADSASGKLVQDHSPLVIRGSESSNSLQVLSNSNPKAIRSDVGRSYPPSKNIISYVSEQASANHRQHAASQSPGMFGELGLGDCSKRIKMKSNVQQLRNVIPGGKFLDTAGLLGRTIHYVKCLQNKQRGLDAARKSAKAMHQIG
ncbi:hypothetical protein L7F22_053346 [Adiantum nelumboides]|nr:hypothetical protein [Adiantum nelumboides]